MANLSTVLADLAQEYPSLDYITIIKTGKEAQVHLIKLGADLRALKVYKDNQKFSTRANYVVMEQVADKRMQKAIAKNSRAGKRGMDNIWVSREAQAMEEAFAAGGNVPEIFKVGHGYLLMEYLGSARIAAPRLSDVTLTATQARVALFDIGQTIYYLLEAGYVHGDLSAYNVLWFKDHAFVIDFPQILDIRTNRHAKEKLHKDLENIKEYFSNILTRDEIDEYLVPLKAFLPN